MNKINDAWDVLKKLSVHEQEIVAEAILDFASQTKLALSEKQAAEVERRRNEKNAKTIPPGELRSRFHIS